MENSDNGLNFESHIVSGLTTRPSKDLEFLKWFKNEIAGGYFPLLDLEKIEDMVKKITRWVEMKYPTSKLKMTEGEATFESDPLAELMNTEALKARMTPAERALFEGRYRMGSGHDFSDETIIFGVPITIFKTCQLKADEGTGRIVSADRNICELISTVPTDMTLEDLYHYLSGNDSLDLRELERIIHTHQKDLTLRSIIFDFVSLSLLTSEKEPMVVGKTRARYWIKEIADEMHLNIRMTEFRQHDDRHKTDVSKDSSEAKKLRIQISDELAKHYTSNRIQ